MSSIRSVPVGPWPAVEARDFGEPFEAFPVEAPFQLRPDLVKLMPVDDWLRVDREWPAMLAAKQAALSGDGGEAAADNVMLAAPCDAATEQARRAAIRRVAGTLAATAAGQRLGLHCAGEELRFEAAGYRAEITAGDVRLRPDRQDAAPVVQVLAAGAGSGGLLGAVAMSLQEDLVLMEQGSDGIARAVVFHVSFPSTWDPATKLGQDLLGLHAPVADNALLQAAARRLGSALVGKGPFVRWVWTVTTDARWRAWPPRASAGRHGADSDAAAPLFFRLERQTTMPLGEGYGLFLIRVQVRPLADVLTRPERLPLLQASLRSMSEAMVRYKGLGGVRDRVLAM